MLNYIIYNNKNSFTDFGLMIESYTISTPRKRKILIEVPYTNSSYDFSYALGDINCYEDRDIRIDFNFVGVSVNEARTRINKINNWLLDTKGKINLTFKNEVGLYYLAEVVDVIDYEFFDRAVKFTVLFTAYPFKTGHCYEGSLKEWDCFNFEEDVLQQSKFTLNNNSVNVNLINVGRELIPLIRVAGANATIIKNGITINLSAGDTTNYNFILKRGDNPFSISSNGSSIVEILWRKELL